MCQHLFLSKETFFVSPVFFFFFEFKQFFLYTKLISPKAKHLSKIYSVTIPTLMSMLMLEREKMCWFFSLQFNYSMYKTLHAFCLFVGVFTSVCFFFSVAHTHTLCFIYDLYTDFEYLAMWFNSKKWKLSEALVDFVRQIGVTWECSNAVKEF